MKILFALAGFHRVNRGAEVALMSVARELSLLGDEVTLIGSGQENPAEPYRFIHAPLISRERFEHWPFFPALRSPESWEDATFMPGLLAKYHPGDFDLTVTCAFPFTHWALRRPRLRGRRPKHVFVTQNGDWPAHSDQAEFRSFRCDGLVCTNPDYLERNASRYRCALIPNGVDLKRFKPGPAERGRFGLPEDGPIALMVSALIPSKNVAQGIEAIARIPSASLVVAGDGPLRDEIDSMASRLLPNRFHRLTVPAFDMPALYRSADVFMHLSSDESFGNVFVEALATGLPIVAWDTDRTRWILGSTNELTADRTCEALAKSVNQALDERGTGAARSLQRAQRFGWPTVAQEYRNFFLDVCSSASERRQRAPDVSGPIRDHA